MNVVKGETYLVTGGSGFLGVPLVGRLADMGASPVVIARNEGNVLNLRDRVPGIRYIFGAVEDPFLVAKAMRGCRGSPTPTRVGPSSGRRR